MVGGAAFALGGLGRLNIARRFGAAEASRDALTIPAPRGSASADRDRARCCETPGISPFITPNADFYRVDTALIVPRVDTDTWRLTIHGMVDREMELTFAQLMSRERHRARHHARVRLERGRRPVHRERPMDRRAR